jgi:hypothetical protein
MTNKTEEIKTFEANEIAFDEATREHMADIDTEMYAAIAKVMEPYQHDKDVVARHFIRANKLSGEWKRKDDNSGLIRPNVPAPVIPLLPETGPITRKPRKRK